MSEDALESIRSVLSSPRLRKYVQASADDLPTALRLYAWNKEVSGAFYGLIGCLEVALRNALQMRLAELFGQDDWWNAPQVGLHYGSKEKLAKARQALLDRRRAATPDAIVAELTFGFWVSLLGTGTNYETRLWRPALRLAFPGYTGPRSRLYAEIKQVNWLRNRIAHYEPIFSRDLGADHASVLRLIRYLSPHLADWAREHDRVAEVLACRKVARDGTRRPRF